MQLHYLRATKQEPLKPTRPLSLKDLEYLHITKFSGRPYVSQVRSPYRLLIYVK